MPDRKKMSAMTIGGELVVDKDTTFNKFIVLMIYIFIHRGTNLTKMAKRSSPERKSLLRYLKATFSLKENVKHTKAQIRDAQAKNIELEESEGYDQEDVTLSRVAATFPQHVFYLMHR